MIVRLNCEIKCRIKAIGALMPVCAKFRHVAGTQWGRRHYMSMEHPNTEDVSLSDFIVR